MATDGTDDAACVAFLQWALPQLNLRSEGFRKVRGTVCKRVRRRLKHLQLMDYAAYRDYLERAPQEWSLLDAFCRLPISRFYRDHGVYNFLREHILPQLAGQLSGGTLRIWSAGCASGEEPYSLALLWLIEVAPHCPPLELQIVATDAEVSLLRRAEKGCYGKSSLHGVPQAWRTQGFVEQDGVWCVRPEPRRLIEFRCQDIRRQMAEGPFHLVLCRNLVFTYFAPHLQKEVLQCIARSMAPDGLLVLGRHEQLPDEDTQFEPYETKLGIYRLRT